MQQAVVQDNQKLKSLLRALAPEALEAIAEFWGVKLPKSESSPSGVQQVYADYLYPRLQTAQYFKPTFEKLDQIEKEVIQFLAIHGGEMGFGEVTERCFYEDDAVSREVLGGLQDKGFVFMAEPEHDIDEELVMVPDSHLAHIELSPNLQGFLGHILHSIPDAQLQKTVEVVVKKKPRSSRRSVLTYVLRKVLLDPGFLKNYIMELQEQDHELLNSILNRKGFCLYRDLLEPGKQKRFDHAKAELLNNLITHSGLIFTVAEGQNKHMNLLMVPRDVYYVITTDFVSDKRSLSELDALSASSSDFRTAMVCDNSKSLLRDVVIFATYFDTQSVKRLANGGISKLDLKKALNCLSPNKTLRYAEFLATFLISKKCIIQVGDEWKTCESFFQWIMDPARCHRDIFTWWQHTADWNEENPDANLLTTESPVRDTMGLLEVRALVLRGLAGLTHDAWISFDAFMDSLLPQIETALPNRISSGYRRTPSNLKPMVQCVLAESLTWLGIVSVGFKEVSALEKIGAKPEPPAKKAGSKSGTGVRKISRMPSAIEFIFRATPIGRNFLDSEWLHTDTPGADEAIHNNYPAGRAQWLIVQPNLEVVAPPDLALEDIFFLANFCTVRNVDVMTTFELTRESLGKALSRGLRGREVLNFLGQRSRGELPETVRHLVNECTSKNGEARIGQAGGYITVDDPMLAEQIRANPKMAPYVKDVISSTVILLTPSSDVNKVAKELRGVGLMAVAESGTVHVTSNDSYHLTLSAQEYYDLLAAVRLVNTLEDTLSTEISDGRVLALAQKLKPERSTYFTMTMGAESTTNAFQKKFDLGFQKLKDEIADKYKGQVSRLVTKSISGRGPSKYNYKGKNPAVEREDIISLLTFAQDYELDAEILYVKQNEQEAKLVITPKSFEGERVYAHNPETDSDAIYSIKRILRARLP